MAAPAAYVLLHHSPAWNLPAACPECLKSMAYLELAVVNFTCHVCYNMPDSDQLPALEDDFERKEVALSSEPGGIIGWLRKHRGIDLDAALTEGERSELRAYTSIVETSLADALQYARWIESENYLTSREAFSIHLPLPLRMVLGWQQRHEAKQKFGSTKDLSKAGEELYTKAAAGYRALAVRLGENSSFFEGRPTSLDAAVAAHLIFVLEAPYEKNLLKEMIESYPFLVRFANEIKRVLQERSYHREPRSPPPFSRIPFGFAGTAPRPPTGTSSKRNEKKTAKELKFKKRARYFVAAQIIAVVAFVFFAGFVEVDEDALDDHVDDDDE
eukprot:TRINITY_DN23822_c0_g1_i1.p1 TRINITY_DN23822_c0_g1~~TRINITY_DN23822_c0_g1_i1.p1  ORF type:complete len:329 (+),score=68.01 TRINITY_DN23822_c0_g1_i1:3-989(+)